ncbi:hypothetical protein, partial [Mycobacterium tuberculosis]|uniref:hypothetical protein n=1 Tax=Mycobacterium tuberculosis TaxID=1773 RepID=UPI003F810E8F
IVTRRGKIARLESGLTPQEAQIEDLATSISLLAIRPSQATPSSAPDRSSLNSSRYVVGKQYLKDKHGLANLELHLLPIEELATL